MTQRPASQKVVADRMDKTRGTLDRCCTVGKWSIVSVSRDPYDLMYWDSTTELAKRLSRAMTWLCFERYGRRKGIFCTNHVVWYIICPSHMFVEVVDAVVDLNNGNVVKAEGLLNNILLADDGPDAKAQCWIASGEGHWK